MSREDELFDKYMLIRQMTETVRNKNTSKAGPFGDTTRGRGRVISLLKQKDGISTKDMAAIMGIRVSSLNEVLGKMENDGYVERTPSPDDRRVMLIWLTDKGKAVQLPDQDLPNILFGSLDQGAKNQLAIYFEQMISSLQNKLEAEGETVKESRDQRNEFFEQAKNQQATQATQQQAAQQQARPVTAPRVVPAAPAVAPVAPPVPPVTPPSNFGA